MKRLKILFFAFLSVNFAFANNEDISSNIIKSASEGRNVIEEQKLEKLDKKTDKENRMRQAVILTILITTKTLKTIQELKNL